MFQVKVAEKILTHIIHSITCCSDVIFCVVHWLIVLFYVVLVCKCVLPPGDNPIAVNKYYYYYNGFFFRNSYPS